MANPINQNVISSCTSTITGTINEVNKLTSSKTIVRTTFPDPIVKTLREYDIHFDTYVQMRYLDFLKYLRLHKGHSYTKNTIYQEIILKALDDFDCKNNACGDYFKDINKCALYIELDYSNFNCKFDVDDNTGNFHQSIDYMKVSEVAKFEQFLYDMTDKCGAYSIIYIAHTRPDNIAGHQTVVLVENRKLLGTGNGLYLVYYDPEGLTKNVLNPSQLINGYLLFQNLERISGGKIQYSGHAYACPLGLQSKVKNFDIGFCTVFSLFWFECTIRCLIQNTLKVLSDNKIQPTINDSVEKIADKIENILFTGFPSDNVYYDFIVNYAYKLISRFTARFPEEGKEFESYYFEFLGAETYEKFNLKPINEHILVAEKNKIIDNLLFQQEQDEMKRTGKVGSFKNPQIQNLRKDIITSELSNEYFVKKNIFFKRNPNTTPAYITKYETEEKNITNQYNKYIDNDLKQIDQFITNMKNTIDKQIFSMKVNISNTNDIISEKQKAIKKAPNGSLLKESLTMDLNYYKTLRNRFNEDLEDLEYNFSQL